MYEQKSCNWVFLCVTNVQTFLKQKVFFTKISDKIVKIVLKYFILILKIHINNNSVYNVKNIYLQLF